MPAKMKERMIPGPAHLAAAVPVMTKMPVPMIAPMPSAVKSRAPRTRLRPESWNSPTGLRTIRRLKMEGGIRSSVWVTLNFSSSSTRHRRPKGGPAVQDITSAPLARNSSHYNKGGENVSSRASEIKANRPANMGDPAEGGTTLAP
ncbi:hypothetical protein D3C86_1141770 [compost metagenome]